MPPTTRCYTTLTRRLLAAAAASLLLSFAACGGETHNEQVCFLLGYDPSCPTGEDAQRRVGSYVASCEDVVDVIAGPTVNPNDNSYYTECCYEVTVEDQGGLCIAT